MRLLPRLRRLLTRERSATDGRRSAWRTFLGDRRGSVIFVFGFALIPLLGLIGASVDYAYAYRLRSKMQSALDAAALAAGRQMDLGAGETAAQQTANEVLSANLGQNFPAGYTSTINIANSIVTASASLTVDTYILAVVGITSLNVGATSIVNIAGGTYEVALVLDNSGSMQGSKITDLKEAASNLVNILFSSELSSEHVKISLVPFAMSVNVGSQYATAEWMDTGGLSSIHKEHFDANVTRWQMFNALNNVSWAGCVETRPSPHDVTDSEPTASDPDTLFVPSFAPDEPDSSSAYPNSYIDDDDGGCPGWLTGGTYYERQRRTCKYYNAWANTNYAYGTRRGPNWGCDASPLMPLTNNKNNVLNAISNMQAYGGTNIVEGLMWGWRTLSPSAPFTEGAAYDKENNAKIVILMSDGANWNYGTSNHNQSWFTAYGYHAQNRLGSPSNNTNTLIDTMNTRTQQACTNAKAAGIIIYTVALQISDSDTINLMRNCATSPSRFFDLNNSNSLNAAFEAIAKEITKLRISG